MSRRLRALATALVLLASGAPALAGPEQVEQLEPEKGEWQAEGSLLASRGATVEPSVQLLRGLSDAVALGVEIEGDGGSIESLSPTILYRFGDRSTGVGVGVVGQVAFASDAELVGSEARIIVERQAPRVWGQGNIIVQANRESKYLSYGWRVSRALGKAMWLGGEGSGQVARLGGPTNADRGHYVGPAVTVAQAMRLGTEVELNGSFLRRIAGEGPTAALLLSVQVGL